MTDALLDDLSHRLDALDGRIEALGSIGDERLRVRPEPNRWSAAECLEHLVITADQYLPMIARGLTVAKPSDEPSRERWSGRFFLSVLSPKKPRRLRAPRAFVPPLDVDPETAVRLRDRNARIRASIESAVTLDRNALVVPNPIFPLYKFSLGDAFRVLVIHEERHLAQAERAAEAARTGANIDGPSVVP